MIIGAVILGVCCASVLSGREVAVRSLLSDFRFKQFSRKDHYDGFQLMRSTG